MRAMFTLVLTVGAAAGAALLMWNDGEQTPRVDDLDPPIDATGESGPGGSGPSSSSADDSARRRVSENPSPAGAAPNADVRVPERADAVAARMRAHLDQSRADLAARDVLQDEAGVLLDDDVRALTLRTADALREEAVRATGAAATRMRLDARRLYAAVYVCDAATADEADRAFDACGVLHRVLVTGAAAPDDVVLRHKFKSGDSLWKLSRNAWRAAGVTAEAGFILHVNGISDARRIRAGQTLRVPRERVSILIRKSRFELTLLLGGAPFERFRVGIGADDSTPEGVFSISTKIENPDWYYGGRKIPYGDPENVIGTRWMGFSGDVTAEGIGIHGTSDETTVGQAVSLGCIRMKRVDVETLFEWISRGTEVDVRR